MSMIRVAGVPEPYNLPWHLAMEKGAFAKAGIDLRWHTVPEGTGRMCQMVRDNELDMAVLVTEGAVRDILTGGPHRIVSTFVESPLPWGVHVPARSELQAAGDLKGVPFAISRKGSGSHLMAMLYARRIGWTPDEQDLVIVNNMEGAAERMRDGEPLIFLWEKFVTSRYVDAGVMRKVDEIQGDWPGFVIVAREDVASQRTDAIHAVRAALYAETRVLMHDRRTLELVMRNTDFSEELARSWLLNVRWNVTVPEAASFDPLISVLRRSGLAEAGNRRSVV